MLFSLTAAESAPVITRFYSLAEFILDALGRAPEAIAAVNIVAALLTMAMAYLLGSVNPAILLSKYVWKGDIRESGTGIPDSANMLDVYGRGAMLATIGCNLLKGALAAFLGLLLWGFNGRALATFFVMFGHVVPVFHRFSGGRGIGAMMGAMAVTSPITAVIFAVILAIGVIGSRLVSFGAMLAALVYPFFLRAFYAIPDLSLAMSVFCAVFVMFAYRDSIRRILDGKEYRLELSQLFGKGGKKK